MAHHTLIDELPTDAKALYLYVVEHGRSPKTGGLWPIPAKNLVKALGWDAVRLRRAQDLIAETGLLEMWPKVMAPGPAWPYVRLTPSGEALGQHGFSPSEFRSKLAAAISVGDVSVSGSRDVTVAIGKHINVARRPRPVSADDISIAAYAAYSSDRMTAVALVEVTSQAEQSFTLCDPRLVLSPGIALSPDPLATGLYADGFETVGCQPLKIRRFARLAWHFFDRGGKLGARLFEGPQQAGLALHCVETGPLSVPCVVYTNGMLRAMQESQSG